MDQGSGRSGPFWKMPVATDDRGSENRTSAVRRQPFPDQIAQVSDLPLVPGRVLPLNRCYAATSAENNHKMTELTQLIRRVKDQTR